VIGIVLVGASGRMGQAIERAAAAEPDVTIAARADERGAFRAETVGAKQGGAGYEPVAVRGASLADVARPGDVVVEFSTPEGFRAAAQACRAQRLPLVSGTTGLSPDDERLIGQLAAAVPVLRAANFSLGVLALQRALGAALASLPASWDIEIVERHHRAKLDSPSGTALALARDAARARGWGEEALRHGREGRSGPRPQREIGMHAVRGGSWVGEHAVLLAGSGESLELRHVAEDRQAFAHGALASARFVATAKPGRYALADVIPPAGRG
jgi:4-hydroxy-tetrahydrodipicolinate reductase